MKNSRRTVDQSWSAAVPLCRHSPGAEHRADLRRRSQHHRQRRVHLRRRGLVQSRHLLPGVDVIKLAFFFVTGGGAKRDIDHHPFQAKLIFASKAIRGLYHKTFVAVIICIAKITSEFVQDSKSN